MSVAASGKFGGAMVFSSSKGRPYVRQLVTPTNPNTAAQQGVRANMEGLNKLWAEMSPENKATWETRAKQFNVSTWNAFVKVNQKDFANGMGDQRTDPAETSTPPSIPTTIVDSVEGRQVTVTCHEPATGDTFGVMLWISQTTGFTPGSGNLKKLVPGSGTPGTVLTFVVAGLEPGEYFYILKGFDYAGDFGTTSAQGSFTIA